MNLWICNYFSSVVSFKLFLSYFILPPPIFLCYFQFLVLLIVFQEAQKVLRRLFLSFEVFWAVLNTWSYRVWRWDEEESNIYFRVLLCYTKCSFPVLLFIARLNEGLAEVVRVMQPCTKVPAELPAGTGYHSLPGKAMDGDGKDAGALWWEQVSLVKCAFSERKQLRPS